VAYNENPRQSPYVRHEIAESWIRSRSYGISMDIDPATKKVKSSTLKHVLKESRALIDVAKPILLKDLAFVRRHSDFSVWLYDRNGIMLLPIHGGKKI
jgi:transcriptional regulator of acetoin/glycerol metabolism